MGSVMTDMEPPTEIPKFSVVKGGSVYRLFCRAGLWKKLMKKNRYLFVLLLIVTLAGIVTAQEDEELPKIEVFGGYSYLRSEGGNFNGWKTGVGFTVNRWLAVAVDADGHYFSENTSHGTLKEREYSVTAGPHFSYRNKSKIVPFAYAMAGVAWERSSLAGDSESHSGFAFETGGGLDWEVSKKVSIRLVDIGASVANIGGHTTVKPKFTTGVVFKFGTR